MTEDQDKRLIDEIEKRLTQRIDYVEAAIRDARVAMADRLETMNEFRDQLKRQADTFALKDVVEVRHRAIEDALQKVENQVAAINGKLWAFGVSLTIFVTVISLLLRFVVK